MKPKKSKFTRYLFWQILWIIIPSLLWLTATFTRPYLIKSHCLVSPSACTPESVLSMDRLSVGMENGLADQYSYWTQNTSGVWAITSPLIWNIIQISTRKCLPGAGLVFMTEDLLTVFQVTSWNGLFTEISHLITQRPRPFVYSNPQQRGIDSAHYTSFYSGHTSYAAAMTTTAFLILMHRQAHRLFLFLAFMASEALIFSTAYFRILAGRHFLSDVICGAIAGAMIAFLITRRRHLQ